MDFLAVIAGLTGQSGAPGRFSDARPVRKAYRNACLRGHGTLTNIPSCIVIYEVDEAALFGRITASLHRKCWRQAPGSVWCGPRFPRNRCLTAANVAAGPTPIEGQYP
jgi:hypothetical protein